MQSLVDLVYTPRAEWGDRARGAFSDALGERYVRMRDLTDRKNDERRFQLRVNGDQKEGAVPCAALIASDQELSGGYGGMSFVMFPADEAATPARRAGEPGLLIRTSTRVGAIPLLSPVTGRADFGLVVEPRFAWAPAGDMLAGTGFRVVPELLPIPELPQSERRVPPWVLSSVVLTRLWALLDSLQRRFAITHADLAAPRGQVDWERYASTRFAVGRALEVPCRFPDLRDDERLRAAIHWVVRRHRDALLGQASAGLVVRRLLELCDRLLARLSGTAPQMPAARTRRGWSGRPLSARVFREGLQAIDWTVDERGLAGLSDLAGLAWRMDIVGGTALPTKACVGADHLLERTQSRYVPRAIRAVRGRGARMVTLWVDDLVITPRAVLLPDTCPECGALFIEPAREPCGLLIASSFPADGALPVS